ncbi:AraC family transcriptional regulator [Mycobacterium conspicuum]|nr:AraC family transcriptional regulator [Mycobacterium conspicuum]
MAARRFFSGAYAPGWRLTGLTTGSAVNHRRCQARSITLDEVLIEGRLRCEIPAADTVVVIQPRAGSLTVTDGPLPTAECPVLVANGTLGALDLNTARFGVVSIAADVLHKAAAERRVPLPQQIQFLSWQPRSPAAVRAWHRALDYVTTTLASADTVGQPMIAAAAAPLLAAALLDCYPSNVTAEDDLLSDATVPRALKDAMSFIHRHAAGDIGVNEIADAVHLTPRAVQYLFRQRLDTTPTEYLRRVRLHRAHQDLRAASHGSATVTEIAQRWGFAHTGRFAVLYRQTYGHSPHTALRQ